VPLMKELGLEIPEWKLKRLLKVQMEPMGQPQDTRALTISAVDVDGIPATVFRDVKLRNNGKPILKRGAVADSKKGKQHPVAKAFRGDVRGEPSDFIFDVASTMVMAPDDGKENENGSKGDDSTGLVAEIEFFGNYREPNLCLPLLSILHPDDTSQNANDQNDNGSNESKESESPFVCRLTMDIATQQWTVEQGVKLEEVVVRDQLKSGRGRRDAERAKKAKEQRSTTLATASEEKQDGIASDEDVLDRASRVLQEFADMKAEFRETIDELGAVCEERFLGGAMNYTMDEIDSNKSEKQLDTVTVDAEVADVDHDVSDHQGNDSEKAKE